MKTYLIPLLAVFAIIFSIESCTKNSDIETPNVYGSWTVLQSDSQGLQYNVELKFNTDNSYDWILLDSVEGHSNSHAEFTFSENIMTITVDADCSSLGEYFVTVEANKLSLIAKTEECGPRAAALEWVWEKK